MSLSFVLCAGFAGASETQVYSSNEYCELKSSINGFYEKNYVKAYAKKLGESPSNALCRKILKTKNNVAKLSIEKSKKNSWNYQFRKPYKGSIRTLPVASIAKLRVAKQNGESIHIDY